MLSKIFKSIKMNWELVLLMLLTIWLRFVNLGYSDFQGDEIKALLIPEEGQSVSNFLLTQRKGPIQFVITYLMGFITTGYSNRLIMRLPFAMAGSLAVFFFFKLLVLHLRSRKLAFFASFFLATNGFFIGFSRIVQYQSFVIFFMILSLYFMTLAIEKDSWKNKGLLLGFSCWALSILSHYDGVFIFPFVLYLMYAWAKKYNQLNFKALVRSFWLPALFFTLLILAFYVPFVLELSKSTLDYWQGRIAGTGNKISSSIYLFRVYQPIYAIYIYLILGSLGTLKILATILVNFKKKNFDKCFLYISILLWFVIPFVFLEGYVKIPGTHIYTYLLPGFIGMALGIRLIEKSLTKFLGRIAFARFLFFLGVSVVFTFLFMQSNQVFVDHQKEYPWESEEFFIWTFPKPTPIFHLSMFGFPYYRNWDEIGRFVMNSENNGFYATNERESIARYHVRLQKSTNDAGHFIYIKNPQSFTNEITNKKAAYWIENYSSIATFFKGSDPVVEIFFMPQGSLEEIQEKGF
ncbi:MAG TPA: phospholipid carrier-dependent glycosyltransferase [bacterium]|nr:phospholipid carrier-dependent glycosyltransferase [bacterium]